MFKSVGRKTFILFVFMKGLSGLTGWFFNKPELISLLSKGPQWKAQTGRAKGTEVRGAQCQFPGIGFRDCAVPSP